MARDIPPTDDAGGSGPGDGRVSVQLGSWSPPTAYDQPQLEPNTNTRTKEHEVLADETVVQRIGEDAERFVLRGDAYASDIYALRYMNGDIVAIQHPVFWGDVLVKSVSASSTSSWDDQGWVYSYTVDLIEVKS
jgi:hypothetical protein